MFLKILYVYENNLIMYLEDVDHILGNVKMYYKMLIIYLIIFDHLFKKFKCV